MQKRIQTLFNPDRFQGWNKTRQYFEGWYYKIVNKEGRSFAFIPGISMDKEGAKHAFVQVLDGNKNTTQYESFKHHLFKSSFRQFEVSIDGNYFSRNKFSINLPNISGHFQLENTVPWPDHWYAPGIMGPFSFVPFMQCYHGIVSMDHTVMGTLNVHGEEIDFSGGRGYIEKDWGSSFPSAYVWMQTNHFSESGISFKASIAKIPWLKSSFTGFIAGVWLRNRLIKFTTYNGSKLVKCSITADLVEVVFDNPKHSLIIRAFRESATSLAAPVLGDMSGRIQESMTSKIGITLFDKKNNKELINDIGVYAALEVAGNTREISV